MGSIGVPGMIALLAFVAFSKQLGWLGVLIGAAAVVLVYLVIGAVVWMGKRRPDA
jgi:predicted PurR-regulated permease PerM